MSKLKVKRPDPSGGVKVLAPEMIEVESLKHPVFCFKHTHKDYGIDNCSDEDKAALLKRLWLLSKMTWQEIHNAPRHGMGTEKISKGSLNVNPPPFITKDVEYLLALRFKGKAPILVHRYKFIMHVIFIDPNFKVYPH